MDALSERLWQDSEIYIASAREHLSPSRLKSHRPKDARSEDERLRISFLFPTLPESSRVDLLSVREHFLKARKQQERERINPDDSAQQSEAMAYHASAQLREALPSFSNVQRQILTHHYLIFPGE